MREALVGEILPSAAGAALAAGAAPAVASAARHPHTRFRGWNTSRERFLLGNQSHNRARMRCDPPCTGGEAAFIGGAAAHAARRVTWARPPRAAGPVRGEVTLLPLVVDCTAPWDADKCGWGHT